MDIAIILLALLRKYTLVIRTKDEDLLIFFVTNKVVIFLCYVCYHSPLFIRVLNLTKLVRSTADYTAKLQCIEFYVSVDYFFSELFTVST